MSDERLERLLRGAVRLPSRDEVAAERQRRGLEQPDSAWLGWLTWQEIGVVADEARAHGGDAGVVMVESPAVDRLLRLSSLRRGLGLEAEDEDAWRCIDAIPGCRCTEAAINRGEEANMAIGDLVDLAKSFAARAHRAIARRSPAEVPPMPPRDPAPAWLLRDESEVFVPAPEPRPPRTSLSPAHVRRVPSDEEVEALNARLGVWPTSRSFTRRGRIYWES